MFSRRHELKWNKVGDAGDAWMPPMRPIGNMAALMPCAQLDKSAFAVKKLIEQYDLLYRAKLQEYFG